MKLTSRFSLIKSEKTTKTGTGNQNLNKPSLLTRIFGLLEPTADKVGSKLYMTKNGNKTSILLNKRPKDRPGRIAWNEKTERVAKSCNSRCGSISVNIISARTGNALEITRRKV